MRITQRHTGPREPCNVVPDDENNAALKVSTRFGFTFWFIGPIVVNKLLVYIFKKVKNHNLRYVLVLILVASASASQADDGDRFDPGGQTKKLL